MAVVNQKGKICSTKSRFSFIARCFFFFKKNCYYEIFSSNNNLMTSFTCICYRERSSSGMLYWTQCTHTLSIARLLKMFLSFKGFFNWNKHSFKMQMWKGGYLLLPYERRKRNSGDQMKKQKDTYKHLIIYLPKDTSYIRFLLYLKVLHKSYNYTGACIFLGETQKT